MVDTIMPTPMQDFLFDLQGLLVLKGALSPTQARRANERADVDLPPSYDPGCALVFDPFSVFFPSELQTHLVSHNPNSNADAPHSNRCANC